MLVPFLLAANVAASGAAPAALVLETSGDVPVQPFEEVAGDQTLELGGSGQVTFMHYGLCTTVVAEGGNLFISPLEYRVEGGSIVSETPEDCPEEVALEGDSSIGGIVLRAAEDPPDLIIGLRPRFAVLDKTVGELQLSYDDTTWTLTRNEEGFFTMAEDAPPLALGRYELSIMNEDGENAKTLTAEVTADAASDKLVVVRKSA